MGCGIFTWIFVVFYVFFVLDSIGFSDGVLRGLVQESTWRFVSLVLKEELGSDSFLDPKGTCCGRTK